MIIAISWGRFYKPRFSDGKIEDKKIWTTGQRTRSQFVVKLEASQTNPSHYTGQVSRPLSYRTGVLCTLPLSLGGNIISLMGVDIAFTYYFSFNLHIISPSISTIICRWQKLQVTTWVIKCSEWKCPVEEIELWFWCIFSHITILPCLEFNFWVTNLPWCRK